MKSTGHWAEGDDDTEMGRDAQNTAQRSKQLKTALAKPQHAATKTGKSPDRLLPSMTTSANANMSGHAECSPSRWDIKSEERPNAPRSADSGFDEPPETNVTSTQEVRPLPCQESPSLSCHTFCGRDSGIEDLIPIPPCISEAEVDALLNATPHPPVTKESLEELELVYIQSNITLRIDINFDHDLHFTPISGDKGEQKKKEAKKYWLSLVAEFRIVYQHSLLSSCAGCDERCSSSSDKRVFKRRLPGLFRKLQELLEILVPDRDQYQISQYLDVPLLLQEVSHGLLDIVRLARWLDVLLTSHCAPMRDNSAHEMAEQIRQGAENGDVLTLVAGIENLFQILESMKLDVANHQIRSFRYLLIDDTVAFQQEFFRSRMGHRSRQAEEARRWYRMALERHQQRQVDGTTPRSLPLAVLAHGMLEGSLSQDLQLPGTMAYDHKRFREIRVDMQDLIHLNISLSVFDELVCELLASNSNASLLPGIVERQVKEMRFRLRYRIMDITDGNPEDVPQIWLQYSEAIALEITRAAFHICVGPGLAIPAYMASNTSQKLASRFEAEHQNQQLARKLAGAIELKAHNYAKKFQNMTTLAISHEQKQWQQFRARRNSWRLLPDAEDIARRLAHIASIHWRVWADLVYLESEHGNEDDFGVHEDDGSFSDEGVQDMMDAPMEYVQHT